MTPVMRHATPGILAALLLAGDARSAEPSPTIVSVSRVNAAPVGARQLFSSTQLTVSWTPSPHEQPGPAGVALRCCCVGTGAATVCSTPADYSIGGGCAPTVAIAVEGDPGGKQYAANGCPKLFTSAQAAFPFHNGGARYRLDYGDPSITDGKGTSNLPFLGPKKLIYADGSATGAPGIVDFEDWEPQTSARDIIFLWPNGEQMDARAEGYIDDYHFLAPTGVLDLQVMYVTITDGASQPLSAAAVLRNP